MRIPKPSGAERDRVLARASAIERLFAETAGTAAERPRVAGLDLWRAASRLDPEALARVRAAAAVDPATARAFAAAVRRASVAVFEEVRAADSGALERRRAGVWTIEVRPSTKRPGRVFVTIEVPQGRTPPRLIAAEFGETLVRPLPVAQDGVVQIVTDESDPLVRAIRDRDARLSLR
ncbi:MAG: hypothetical protein ACFBWO_03265 [Paracoccaceae bacterium]